MQVILFSFFIGLFFALLFTNFYYKSKLLKKFRILSQKKVVFRLSHLISEEKMRKEIIPFYPETREDILDFQLLIKKAFATMIVIFIMISIVGYFVMSSKV